MLLSQSNPTSIHDLEQLGAALRDARRSLGLTQVDAAQLSGVSPLLWNETELGKRR
jgi:transcriptional regulator with XRE-family HTH domain